MTIEVKQLLVKSTVTQRIGKEEQRPAGECDTAQLKAEILAECREMLAELLKRQKER